MLFLLSSFDSHTYAERWTHFGDIQQMLKKCKCICGACKLDVNMLRIHICYCNMCKKYSGSEFCCYIAVPKDTFKNFTDPKIFITGKNSIRYFCNHCNTFLGIFYHEDENAYLSMGLVDTIVENVPIVEHFQKNKQKCDAIQFWISSSRGNRKK